MSREPNIVAFCCNWCAYAGADRAGVSRYQYSPRIRIVRVIQAQVGIGLEARLLG